MEEMLKPEEFFDLSECPFASLFEGVNFVWEILPRIPGFLRSFLRPQILGEVMEGAFLWGNDIYIGPGTVVEPGALIKAPVYISAECEIRQGAYVRGNVLVGKRSIIGHATEIKNSIVLNHASAAHFNYVGDSILGNYVNLGAGTRLANLKNMDSEVIIRYGEREFPTGLRKFGAILGDGVKTGCNAVSNPGTIVGRDTIIYPCLSIRGVIPAGSILKQKEPYLIQIHTKSRPLKTGHNLP